MLGRLGVGEAIQPARDVFDRAVPDQGPELVAGDAGLLHLTGAEERPGKTGAKALEERPGWDLAHASLANLLAIVTARDTHGIMGDKLAHSVIYLTEHVHHSVDKAIHVAGLSACVKRQVPVDGRYRMDVDALHRAITADRAALLVHDILTYQPMSQWVLSFPFPLRFLFASNPKAMTGVLGIVYRAIATHLSHKAGLTKPAAQTGAVTLIQHFGSALNLNIHFHMLFLDGVYTRGTKRYPMRFLKVKSPTMRST